MTAPATTGPASNRASPSRRFGQRSRRRRSGSCAGACRRDRAKPRLPSSRASRSTTPRLHGSIDLLGARLDDLTLANYHETVDPKSPEVELLSPPGNTGPLSRRIRLGLPSAPTSKCRDRKRGGPTSGGPLTPANPVTLTWDNGQGLFFTRAISVDPNYMFTVRDSVRNTGETPVKLLPYGLISRTGTPHVAGYYILHEGLIGYLGGSLQEVKYSSLSPGNTARSIRSDGRVARLHRQILADLADPAAE